MAGGHGDPERERIAQYVRILQRWALEEEPGDAPTPRAEDAPAKIDD